MTGRNTLRIGQSGPKELKLVKMLALNSLEKEWIRERREDNQLEKNEKSIG